ncbi:apolipoprotein N-acyltransferase [Bordetella genomosp. 13]|uniref:Apolipoprotein N-acyltransferase n=1 Tax=Bordetella genomosp. 13 TaxID=463040 RepID=A0A1W6Z9F7_9BORD|nr:apolipoprotein N-acyltransferase [Bordetella genomosp. 13]ARP93959.1 apolipoprotein N-acyltransferase [Bordetella genomosp. 13]
MKATSGVPAWLRGAGLLALAGAVHALTFAPGPLPPWSLAIVQVLALAVLARATRDAARAWHAFARGCWFGLFSFSIGLYWLYISMNHYGGLAAPLAVAGVVALSAFLALFGGLAGALSVWLRPVGRDASPLAQALTWAAAWAGAEWLRSVLFTGFPWLNIGYAHVDSPLAGWAPLLGVHGMALFAALAAAALAGVPLFSGTRLRPAAATLATAAVLALAGWPLARIAWSSADGSPLNVRLVQGNIGQSQKFDPALLEHGIVTHLRLAAQPPAPGEPAPDLIVLPETVLPLFQDQLDLRVWETWRAVAERQGSAIAMGAPLHTVEPDGRERYTNSAIGFDANTPAEQIAAGTMAQRYDKRHLVPWGEYVPFGFGWFVQMLNIPLGEFDRGPVRQDPFLVKGQHLAFNICYEDLFGPELLPAILPGPNGEPGATILVNLSNLGWFGDSWALRQHLQIGRLRSIETARPMLTVTNTGITASIDPHGRVVAEMAPHQAGVLPVTVQGMTGLTPYARYGDAPLLVLAGALLIAAAARRGRRNA